MLSTNLKKKTQLFNVEYKFEKRKVNYLMLSTNLKKEKSIT